MHAALSIAIAILIPNVGGFLNAAFVTRRNIKPWHSHLRKPAFNPPNWLFAPTWIALYSIIGYASYRVWTSEPLEDVSKLWIAAIAVYGCQLALNFAWSPVFFGWHNMRGVRMCVCCDELCFNFMFAQGFYIMVLLDAFALTNAVLFGLRDILAGCLFLPYLLWLGFATYLNFSIWQLNKED